MESTCPKWQETGLLWGKRQSRGWGTHVKHNGRGTGVKEAVKRVARLQENQGLISSSPSRREFLLISGGFESPLCGSFWDSTVGSGICGCEVNITHTGFAVTSLGYHPPSLWDTYLSRLHNNTYFSNANNIYMKLILFSQNRCYKLLKQIMGKEKTY